MSPEYFVITRAVHFGACLLLFGLLVFDRLTAAPTLAGDGMELAAYWRSRLRLFQMILVPVILVSGIFWFILVTATMGDLPFRQALAPEILQTVWSQTGFGTVWKWRLLFWCAAAVVAPIAWLTKPQTALRRRLIWFELSLVACLLGSLAWAGHGQEDSPWHLLADILHLLVAGFWPTGLLPLFLLVRQLRRKPIGEQIPALAALIHRFSTLSLASVALLVLTGWVNTWYLVGSFSNLVQQPYGRWLLVKIAFFIIAVAIGAVNLLRLKPRLAPGKFPAATAEASSAQLQFNVQLELALGTAIIILVAILGILPPAVH